MEIISTQDIIDFTTSLSAESGEKIRKDVTAFLTTHKADSAATEKLKLAMLELFAEATN
jgi:hypothetical protein